MGDTSDVGVAAFASEVAEKEKRWQQKAIRSSEVSTFSKRLRVLMQDVASGVECKRKEKLLKELEGWILEKRKTTPMQKRRRHPAREDVDASADDFEFIPTALQRVQNLSLKAFGSSEMGLSLKGGDLDISLEGKVGSEALGHWRMCGKHGSKFEKDLLKEVHKALKKKHFGKNELILGTRIPVSKFAERTTGIECDLSVGNTLGVFKSRLLGKVIRLDPRVKELIVLVKEWARANHINHSPSGTFNSYCLTLAVICFCQTRTPKILPPFNELFPGLRDGMKSRKPLLSLLEVYDRKLKKWMEANKDFSSSNKEPLFNLFINFLVAFRVFALHSAKCARSTGKLFAGSAWDGGFRPMAWNKTGYILVDDPFEPFPNNTARTLNDKGWGLFLEILHRSDTAIQDFTRGGGGDWSKKFWQLWKDLFNRPHKNDPGGPTRRKNKGKEKKSSPNEIQQHKPPAVVIANRLANGRIATSPPEAQSNMAGPSRGPFPSPPAGPSGIPGGRSESSRRPSSTAPQSAAMSSKSRSKTSEAKRAANAALSKNAGTPLHNAAESGSTQNLKKLLNPQHPNAKKLHPDAMNGKGETPLMLAAIEGHLPCVELLLDKGAKKDLRNKWGEDAKAVIGLHLSRLYKKDCEQLVDMTVNSTSDKKLRDAQKLAMKYINMPGKDSEVRARKQASMRNFASTPWTVEDAVKRITNRAKLEKLLSY